MNEDAVLKKAVDVFKKSTVKYFGIYTKIIEQAETEIRYTDVGSISDNVKKEEDLEILKKWLKIAARVNSIDEFKNKIELN